jgi:fatty acid elongase 3
MVNVAETILGFLPPQAKTLLPSYLVRYEPGVTPLSETSHVVATLIGYLVTVFGIKYLRRNKQALKLTFFFQAHNLFLTTISGLLLVLIAEEIGPILYQRGLFAAICYPRSWTEVCVHFIC